MKLSLEKRTALVAGSTSGIGRAIAVQFAKAGANLILLARDTGKLESLQSSLPVVNEDQKHEYIAADFQDPDKLEEKIAATIKAGATVDILVNNTGGPPAGAAHQADTSAYTNAFQMHLICNQILTQHTITHMKEQQWGRIINVISTSVREPIPGLGVSNTIRGAVGNWSKTIAKELAPFGITVNNILPGSTRTGRLEELFESWGKDQGKSTREVEEDMISKIPAGRLATPEEPAYAAVFLASEFASYISGINIPVDGAKMNTY